MPEEIIFGPRINISDRELVAAYKKEEWVGDGNLRTPLGREYFRRKIGEMMREACRPLILTVEVNRGGKQEIVQGSREELRKLYGLDIPRQELMDTLRSVRF